MNCAILFLVILSANPCATWDHAQISFEEARKRMWWTHRTLDPFYSPTQDTWPDPRLEELDGWTLIEHPSAFPDPRNGVLLDGLIDTGRRTIEFNILSPLLPMEHEFTHFLFWKHPIPYGALWQFAGHGGLPRVGSLDIMTHALWLQLCEVLFKPFCEQAHQYGPQSVFTPALNAAAEFRCSTGVGPLEYEHR